jgi:hypothetical protein
MVDRDLAQVLMEVMGIKVYGQLKMYAPSFFDEKYLVTKVPSELDEDCSYDNLEVRIESFGSRKGEIFPAHKLVWMARRGDVKLVFSPYEKKEGGMLFDNPRLIIAQFLPSDSLEFGEASVLYMVGGGYPRGEEVEDGDIIDADKFVEGLKRYIHFAFVPEE